MAIIIAPFYSRKKHAHICKQISTALWESINNFCNVNEPEIKFYANQKLAWSSCTKLLNTKLPRKFVYDYFQNLRPL